MQDVKVCMVSSKDLFISGQQEKSLTIFTTNKTSYLIRLGLPQEDPQDLVIRDAKNSYTCRWNSSISQQYGLRLSQLLLHVNYSTNLSRNWPAIYEILEYKGEVAREFAVGEISYGEEVLLERTQGSGPRLQKRIVSNCWNQGGYYFYFIQNEESQPGRQDFGIIINQEQNKIYGVAITINEKDLVCLPFSAILKQRLPQLRIVPLVQHLLRKTVYLQVRGNYCTGTLISDDSILTVRHAFPDKDPKLGTTLNVKLYPYIQTAKAILTSFPEANLDVVIVRICKESLPQTTTIGHDEAYSHLSGQAVRIGEKVLALGFGKYRYSKETFKGVDVVLPTIMAGIVSKTLSIDSEVVLFKTDASLYPGFSGGAIWSNGGIQVGMAVFCIKNLSTSSHLNKQNFSYLTAFLRRYLGGGLKKSKNRSQVSVWLGSIEQFTTRQSIKIRSRL